jgi:hypothetical protein
MYGIYASFGSGGALAGLTLGKQLLELTNMRSINGISIGLIVIYLITIWCSKIYKDR